MTMAFSAEVLQQHQVSFFHCPACGFLQSEEPYWLEAAYSDAIAVADTGLVMRNLDIAKKLATLLYFGFDPRAKYVDVAGGYGMLTRLMRDDGFDFHWDDKFCANLLARGFEADPGQQPFAACTAFEVLEHVHDPLAFISEQFTRYGCRTLIFTTELYAGNTPPAKDWWYYAFNTGQHISFYSQKTLEAIAGQLKLDFYTFRGIHILTDQKLKFSPLLRILLIPKVASALTWLIRKKQGSLTFSDHEALMNALNRK